MTNLKLMEFQFVNYVNDSGRHTLKVLTVIKARNFIKIKRQNN